MSNNIRTSAHRTTRFINANSINATSLSSGEIVQFYSVFKSQESPVTFMDSALPKNIPHDFLKSIEDAILNEMKHVEEGLESASEVRKVQPEVLKYYAVGLQAIQGQADEKQVVAVPGQSFKLSRQRPSEKQITRCRVMFPVSGKSDLCVAAVKPSGDILHEGDGFSNEEDQESDDIVFDASSEGDSEDIEPQRKKTKLDTDGNLAVFGIGLPSEVKKDKDLDKIGTVSNHSYIIQAAVYASWLLLRVFPMLSDEEIETIFPDRRIYAPLLSHRQLIMVSVEVGLPFLYKGTLTATASEPVYGTDYAALLSKYLLWAKKVATSLRDKSAALMELKPRNCWIKYDLVKSFVKSLNSKELSRYLEGMKASPSFFNPIFRNEKWYVRIVRTFWTGNLKANNVVQENPDLLRDWVETTRLQILPNYGRDVAHDLPRDTAELKIFALSTLSCLKRLTSRSFVHGDLRLENIVWKRDEYSNPQHVHLIDFDRRMRFRNSVQQNTATYLPSDYVFSDRYDIYSFGVCILRCVLKDLSALENMLIEYKEGLSSGSVKDCSLISDWLKKETFLPEFQEKWTELGKICLMCLDVASRRASADEVSVALESL